jgi:hypothetical protein
MFSHRGTKVAAVGVIGVLVALGVWRTAGGESGAGHATSPVPTAEVPSVLPARGVRVEDVVLKPWAAQPSGAMTMSQAINAARPYANAHHFQAKALRAAVRLRGSTITSRDGVISWVVTFTSPKPIDVGQGPAGSPPDYVTHFSVALNAVTRKFVLAFFTR